MKNLIIAFSLISIFYQVIYAQSDTFLSNPPGKWTFPNNITYDYNNTLPNEFINAIDAAAQTWNNSQVGIQFAQQTNSGNQFKYADCGSGPDGFILAITTSTVSSGTVWLANTTITSNTNVTWNTGMEDAIFPSNDLESNILHELGHWLNLADNNTNTNAVMYKILSPGITKRDLTYYDTQPVYNLYLATGICNTCLPYPTHLTASIVGQNIILNWINPTYTNDCYELQVYKNGNFLGNVPSLTSTSYTDVNGVSTLPANYYISVLGNGTGKSSTINISVSPSIIGLNSTWKGVIYSNNNVTINSSVLLTVEPGTNIYFDSGKSLVVNGTLIADGGSNLNPITFNFISPNSTLNNGIVFSNGSSGIINYC